MSNNSQFEFSLSKAYLKPLNRQKNIVLIAVIPAFALLSILLLKTFFSDVEYGYIISIAISVLMIGLIYLITIWMMTDIKLIVNSNGLSTNKAIYNFALKQHYRWEKVIAIIEIPIIEPVFINAFLGLRIQNLPDEKVYIPTHVKSMPIPLAFSDKAWINQTISLGDAIKQVSQKDIIHTSSSDYQKNHASFGSQMDLGKSVEKATYTSVVLFFIALAFMFLDDLFTLNFGLIKLYMFAMGGLASVMAFAYFWLRQQTKKPELLLGQAMVSGLLGVSFTCLCYATFNFFHKDFANTEMVTFTLKKATHGDRPYDLWESEYGHIDCKHSDVAEATKFELNVNSLLTVMRYKMGEICLADERKKEKQAE